MTSKTARRKSRSRSPVAAAMPSTAASASVTRSGPVARGISVEQAPRPQKRASSQRKAALRARSGIKVAEPKPEAQEFVYPIGKGRKALKGIAIYMHPVAKQQLDKIAGEHGSTLQDLGLEALNLLFLHYGEKPIA